MKLLIAVIGTAGLGSIALMYVILARLTQRWEVVTKSKSYYYLFYVSAALITVAALARLFRIGYMSADAGLPVLNEPQSWFYVGVYHVPLIAGMLISLRVAWRNWGWLLRQTSD